MIKGSKLVSVIVGLLSLSIGNSVFSKNIGFEAAEHILVGKNVKLSFDDTKEQTNRLLHLANGLAFTYPQLLAISGDFYGVPDQIISEGKTFEERKQRFIEAYNTLAVDPNAVTEAPKIFALIQKEVDLIKEALEKGEKPEDVYAKISDDFNRQWNCMTGGGCDDLWWLNEGRYLTLSKNDYDHFGENSWLAYEAGHAVAIDTAIMAHQTHNKDLLEKAYTIEAFASHYLSDRYSSGHLRTPRIELPRHVVPSVLGAVLTRFMHNEENVQGLHVHNLNGEHWFAAGDKYLFNPINNENKQHLEHVLQDSVNEIYKAYQAQLPTHNYIYHQIPFADEVGSSVHQDIAPLFYWNDADHALYRRVDVNNPYDAHWTKSWWGWSTVMLLAAGRGIPTLMQQSIIAAGYGKKAMDEGLITRPELVKYVKEKQSR